MKRLVLFPLLLTSAFAVSVSMNFSGQFRSEAAYYGKPSLGSGSNSAKSYISGRALLDPNLVIDDHFSVKSQWSLLTSPSLTPNAVTPLGVGQGGYVFGDVKTAALVLNRAWLEWTSDFGVLRVGRMPVSWGYGLLWDAGNGMWDNWQTTFDRVEYRLHLGHVVGALAYTKPRKLSVQGSDNDQDFYTIYLQYNNPEMDFEGGILFEKQQRSTGQSGDLLGTSPAGADPATTSNPYRLPTGYASPYPLSNKTPFPLSNNVLDLYLKKSFGYFTLGGEVGWLTGTAVDYNSSGKPDDLNAFGLVLSSSFEYHKLRAFLEFLYASGDSNVTGDHLNGFVSLHRNRSPGLILGHELLGIYSGNTVGHGSMVVYGDSDVFSGAVYLRPGFRLDWSSSWSSGAEFIFAYKAQTGASESKYLGTELDLGTEYSVYKNFDLGLNFGYLLPGDGLRVPSPSGVFAVRTTAALKF